MRIDISKTKDELGRKAAADGAGRIRQAIGKRGAANVILATGASQFEMLAALTAAPDVDWSRVVCFHLDDYINMPVTHPASFHKYLRERFISRLPGKLGAFHFLDGQKDAACECRRVGDLIRRNPVDVAFIGIGENGHLAFNDPPANFTTDEPYLVVDLDEPCRRQQFGEGWFPSLEAVPQRAISMSIRQIMLSRAIVCSVPDARKAKAVKAAWEGPVTPLVPASILHQHADATVYLDEHSAALLNKK